MTWTTTLTTSLRIKSSNPSTIQAFVPLSIPFDYFFDLQVTPDTVHDLNCLTKQLNELEVAEMH